MKSHVDSMTLISVCHARRDCEFQLQVLAWVVDLRT